MDILFVQPMPYSLVQGADAVFCLSDGYMATAFFGGSPDCRLFRDITKSAFASYRRDVYQSTSAEAVYRLAGTERWQKIMVPGEKCLDQLRQQYADLSLMKLPQETVYPYHWANIGQIFTRTQKLPPRCVGIHWFGGTALSQKWNEKLTHKNFRKYENTYAAYGAHICQSGRYSTRPSK